MTNEKLFTEIQNRFQGMEVYVGESFSSGVGSKRFIHARINEIFFSVYHPKTAEDLLSELPTLEQFKKLHLAEKIAELERELAKLKS